MQDEWLKKKANEVQLYADTKNSRMFFRALKALYGPSRPSTTHPSSVNERRAVKEKKAMNERWKEHFSTLLNRPSTVSNEALDQIPQIPTLDSLELPPSLEEVHKAIQQTSSGKKPWQRRDPCRNFQDYDLLCSI
ncbi:hypothetical protein ACOMHN_027568 [Nucella lapillus]